ncbi:MAG: 50S ribosomal protein L28 [Patescibacteria group bacterium]
MKKCEVCDKGSIMRGHRVKLRGHYNPQPKTRKYPNLQSFRSPEGKKMVACAKCIKAAGRAIG